MRGFNGGVIKQAINLSSKSICVTHAMQIAGISRIREDETVINK
jgi:hypothetical protein